MTLKKKLLILNKMQLLCLSILSGFSRGTKFTECISLRFLTCAPMRVQCVVCEFKVSLGLQELIPVQFPKL